ncbi:MAG: ribosome biogenesis GTPase Der [Thermoguttaceae bacterium]|nr:ribosome biogenesis GTPase Der [Thermoguttaceae bacterium]
MGIAKVAIVGRPNVGKSSIFNWLIGEKVSVVDSVAGVTRDRVSYLLELPGSGKMTDSAPVPDGEDQSPIGQADYIDDTRYIELTDTGGIGVVDQDDLSEDVERQIALAIESADLILFVTDARTGIAPLDEAVAERLRRLSIPILLAANKSDDAVQEKNALEFERFGWPVIPVSAKQKRGRVRLMDEIEQALPPEAFDDASGEEPIMKLAIVGRRNVGKSTFVNTLAQAERVIASPIPGTTRDCVDVRIEMDGKTFLVIDTPGFMRKKSIGSDLDFYALTRAERSIRRADVVLMFFDAHQRISKMDKQLVSLIDRHLRPVIFVVNKWDLMAEYMPTGRWGEYLRETFATMPHVPIAFLTGKTGKNAPRLLRQARVLAAQNRARVSTNKLNRVLSAALDLTPPPLCHFRKPKIYYAVQASAAPPTLILFCNMPDAFPPNYQRYLLSVLRDELPFSEVPIRLIFRKRGRDDTADEIERNRKS